MPVPSSPCCYLSPFYLPTYHQASTSHTSPRSLPWLHLLWIPQVTHVLCWLLGPSTLSSSCLHHLTVSPAASLPGCAPQHLAQGWGQRRCPGPVCWNEQNVLMVLVTLNLRSYSSSCLVAFKFWHRYLLIVWAWAGHSISLSLNFPIHNYNPIS